MNHDRLPPELESLMAAERDVPSAPAEARGRVLARLSATVGLVPPTVASAPTAASAAVSSVKLAIIVVAVTTVGAGVYFATSRPKPQAVPRPTAGAPSVPEPQPHAPTVPETTGPADPTPPPAPSGAPARVRERPTLAEERTFIEAAHAALADRDAAVALTKLSEHARRFPRGQLREERDALEVVALARAGRGAEAAARGRQFLASHPTSLHRAVVEAALREAER